MSYERLVGTGEAHARTAFCCPKSLQPRCASRRAGPQTCCLGFEGVLETPKRCIRRVVLGWTTWPLREEAAAGVPFWSAKNAAPQQARLRLTPSRRRHHCNSQIPARIAQAGARTTAAIAPRSKRKRNASRAAARQARERHGRRGGRRRDWERHARARGHPPGRRGRGRGVVPRSAQIKCRDLHAIEATSAR